MNQVEISELHLELLVSEQIKVGIISGGGIISWPVVGVHSETQRHREITTMASEWKGPTF